MCDIHLDSAHHLTCNYAFASADIEVGFIDWED